jgi:hypothetical protein
MKIENGVHSAGPHFGPRHSVRPGPANPMDKVRRERRCKHQGSQGRVPDMEAATGAYPSGTAVVRCRGGGPTAAFEAVEALRWSAVVG